MIVSFCKKFILNDQKRIRKSGFLMCSVFALFVIVNACTYVVFLHKTYPNTMVNTYSIGSTAYGSIATKTSHLPLLPSTFKLVENTDTVTVAPAQLGAHVNVLAIAGSAHKRYWLPIANFVLAHKLAGSLRVNTAVLTEKLEQIAQSNNQAPVNAQIGLRNGQFSVVAANNGFQLDVQEAVQLAQSAIIAGKTSVNLPYKAVVPTITAAALQAQLQKLQSEQRASLSYDYDGTVTRPSTAIIANWYSLEGNGYVIQASKVAAYINQVGSDNHINVQNSSAAVSATIAAIEDDSAANITLVAVPPGVCSANTRTQLVIVSIAQQHMWACSSYSQVYDSPVITGIESLPADLTPPGTYTVFAKQTNLYLNGSDSTGSWHDYVNYWMPFLVNQYGTYGFHDATWRAPTDFGTISPNSTNGSHGCVELPLATAAWLYGWLSVGATVQINS
jgi:lipoprotein-anchoring transpeptidase ErfK/SrfK